MTLVVAPEDGGDGAFVLEDLEDVGNVFDGDVVDYQLVDEFLSALCVDVASEGLAFDGDSFFVACGVGAGFGVDLAFGGGEGGVGGEVGDGGE